MDNFKTTINYRGNLWHCTVDGNRVTVHVGMATYLYVHGKDKPEFYRKRGDGLLPTRLAINAGRKRTALYIVGEQALREAAAAAAKTED